MALRCDALDLAKGAGLSPILYLLPFLLGTSGIAFGHTLTEVDHLIRQGEFDAAAQVASSVSSGPSTSRWLTHYVEGYRCLAEGKLVCAEENARQSLTHSKDEVRARHLLINVLLSQENHRAAVFHVRKNINSTPDADMRRAYKNYLDSAAKAVPAFGISIGMTAMPSSNASRGTGSKTIYLDGIPFTVDEKSSEQSGGTVTASLGGFLRHQLTDSSELIGKLTASYEKAVGYEAEDVLTISPAIIYTKYIAPLTWSLGPVGEVQWEDDSLFAYRLGGAMAMEGEVFDNTQINLAIRLEGQNFPDRSYLDGWRLILQSAIEKELSSNLYGGLFLDLRREEAQLDRLSFTQIEAGGSIARTWDNGFYTRAQLTFGKREYDAGGVLSAEPRQDDILKFEIGASHKSIKVFGVLPYIGYRYTRNTSSIDLYSYESNDLILGSTKRF